MDSILNFVLYQPISWLLNLFYNLVSNYGVAIFLLTLIIRMVLLPSSIRQQRGTAKQIRMKPKIAKIQKKYGTDKRKVQEETQALYAREGYNPMSAGCLPMILNLVVMIGLYNVIYNPLTFILKLPKDLIEQAKNALMATGIPQSSGMEMVMMNHFDKLPMLSGQGVETLKAGFNFLGLDLTMKPEFTNFNIIWIIPLLSGLTSFAVSFLTMRKQKQTNPEMSSNPMMGCMTYGMPLFSLYIAFNFPAGVGFYWICSNIIAFVQTYVVNKIYSPNRLVARLFIDETIERRSKEERKLKLSAAKESDLA